MSRQDVRAARVVLTQSHALYAPPPCAAPDHCAAPAALLELARANDRASTATAVRNSAILLDDPDAALAARLNLIAGARYSIDVQTYLWSFDDVGNLMLAALLRAAQRGVTVRILADQLFSFPDVGTLAALARSSPHLHIRLYNPTFDEAHTQPLQWAAGIVCCYFRCNQRMHDKLLLVDGRVGIVGGRNYENRYFGWDPSLDYLDRDVLLAGPVARSMRRSFDVFWHNPRALPLPRLRDVNQSLRATGAEGPAWTPQPSAEMSAQALGAAMPQAGAVASIAPERAPVLSVFDYPAPLLTSGPRISLHAKSYVIDGRIAVIGSHNFDPRSDHYNTENGVVIDDTAFAQALRASILRATRPDNAWVVARRDNPPLLGPISRVLGDISAALPIFDFWPFRYATDWQKKPDCPPLLPSDRRFRQCYE